MEDGVTKIVFVKSADNDSDILTKNVSVKLHEKHSNKMVIKLVEKDDNAEDGKSHKTRHLLYGVDGNQYGQEVNHHQKSDDNKESPSGAEKKKGVDYFDTTVLGDCKPSIEILLHTIINKMQAILIRLLFHQTVAKTSGSTRDRFS